MNLFTRARNFAGDVVDNVVDAIRPQRPTNIAQVARSFNPGAAIGMSWGAPKAPVVQRPRFEDSTLVRGPQGPVPRSADVANFNLAPPNVPEDAIYTMGPQGFYPINADVANFDLTPNNMPEDAGFVQGPQGFVPRSSDVANWQVRSGRSYGRF